MPPVTSATHTNPMDSVTLRDASFPARESIDLQKANAAKDAQTLRDCMKGLGTDETGITTLLGARTHEQIDRIRTSYKEQFGSSLVSDLVSELGTTSAAFSQSMSAIYGERVWALTSIAKNYLGTGESGSTISYNPVPALSLLSECDSDTLRQISTAYRDASSAKWAGTIDGPNLRKDVQYWREKDPAYEAKATEILARIDQNP